MTLPKMMAAALVAALLALAAAPARSAETATADDTARFLAGLPPAPDSPLAELAKGPLWQRHARYFDTIFEREDSANLSKIRAFSRERLTDKHETMLYMFSGPDFLYATSFFPTASTYVLAGLEPVGEIPPLTALSHPTVEWTLRNLESSLGSLLSFSFFITKNMKTQLHEGPVYGTLPILYVFLARTGKTIHDVSFVSLDEDGNFQAPTEAAAPDDGKNSAKGARAKAAERAVRSAAKGVKIVFSEGAGPNQTLYYFSTNLADDSVRRSGFLAFCAKLGDADSFTQKRVLPDARRRLQQGARFPARPQRHDPAGRQRYPAGLFRSEKMAAAAVRPLYRSHRHLRTRLSIPLGGAVPQGQCDPDRLRGWISVAEERIQPAAGAEDRGQNQRNRISTAFTNGSLSSQHRHPSREQDASAAGSPKSHRKRVESETTGSLGCRLRGIFSFCSTPDTKASR